MHNLYDIARKLDHVSALLTVLLFIVVGIALLLVGKSAEYERRIKALEQAQQPKVTFHACPWSSDAAHHAQFRASPVFFA